MHKTANISQPHENTGRKTKQTPQTRGLKLSSKTHEMGKHVTHDDRRAPPELEGEPPSVGVVTTLCMTQVIFPTIVYRQIISLIFHGVTIPVGQKFTNTKLTVPLNSLDISENDVMALEASDWLIHWQQR